MINMNSQGKTKGKKQKGPAQTAAKPLAREGKLVIKPLPRPGNLGASLLVAAITNPYAFSVRYGGGFTREFTALARPHQISTDDGSIASSYRTSDFDGSMLHAISRDPLHHHAYTVPNINMVEWYAAPCFRTRNPLGAAVFSRYMLANSNVLAGEVALDVQYLTPDNVASVPFIGARRYAVMADGHDWFWVDARNTTPKIAGDTLFGAAFFNSAGSLKAPSGAVIFGTGTLYRYGNTTAAFTFTLNSSLNGWTNCNGATATEKYLDASGFYRLELAVDPIYSLIVDVDVYFTFGIHGKTTTVRVDPIPGIDLRDSDIFDLRVVGSSLMCSPTGVSETTGGTMYGSMFPTGTSLLNFISTNAEVPLSRSPLFDDHVSTQPFSKGMYAWHNVTSEEDFEPQNPFVHSTVNTPSFTGGAPIETTNTVVGYRAHMFPRGGWTVICAQPALPNNPASANGMPVFSGSKIRVTIASSVEFSTRSTWYDTQQAQAQDTIPAARLMLARVPNFYENPTHLADIKNWLSRNWRGMAKAGLSAAGFLKPELVPLAGAASALL